MRLLNTCDNFLQDRVAKYEDIVKDHQKYSTVHGTTIEWVTGLKEKVSLCADVSGDKHTAQNRLERLKVCFFS